MSSVKPSVKPSVKRDYLSTVRFSENLAAKIDALVKSELGKTMGFRSRADFVTQAIRDYMREDLTPVHIPSEILRLINTLVKDSGKWTSNQDYIIEAIRIRLREHNVY